jgi:hypothetical protein
MTDLAGDRPLERQRCLKAAHRVEKIYLHGRLDILPSPWTRSRFATCRGKITQITKEAAQILHIKFVGAARIEFALLRITQDIVGDRDLFELTFGFLISRVDVRVILSSEFAVRLTDVFAGGAAVDSKNLVVITVSHGRCRISPARGVARGERSGYILNLCQGGAIILFKIVQ